MNRLLALLAAGLLFTVCLGIIVMTTLESQSEGDYRVERGRALLEAENYLEALRTLRDLPADRSARPETRSYLGAAYLRLHLYEAAIGEFRAAIDQKPRQSDPWIGLAATYMQLGDARRAREEAATATGVDQQSHDAWITLGRAHWLEGSFNEAERAGLTAQQLVSGSPAAADLLLHIYSDQNKTDKFQALLDRTPQLSLPNQDLAVTFYVRQGQFGRAWDLKRRFESAVTQRSILEAELALKRDPGAANLYPGLISNLVKAGRFEEAIQAASVYRGNESIDLELGKAYWMTGSMDRAVSAFTRASEGLVHKLSAEVALAAITGDIRHWREVFRAERIEQDYFILSRLEGSIPAADPVVAAFAYRYAGLYDPSMYTRAADAALRAIQTDPLNLDALLTLGTSYHHLNRIEEALRYVELANREYPMNAEPWSRLASLTIQKGDSPRTLQLMERSVELEPTNAGYLYNLGWLHDRMGNTNQAAALYERAIRASPLSFEAMNNLALIYGQSGEANRALPLLERAIRTDPQSEIAYFNLASHYIRQRDWTHAARNFDQVLRINPANAAAGVEKGRLDLDSGRLDAAIELLNRALDADPHSLEAYLLLASAYERKGYSAEAAAAMQEAERIRARSAAER